MLVLVEGNPKTKVVNIYGTFVERSAARDFAYEAMMDMKYVKIVPLLEPVFEEEEQPNLA